MRRWSIWSDAAASGVRLARMPGPPSARALVEAFFAEALPDDQESRTFQLIWTSYAVLAMTDPELAELPFVAGPVWLEEELAGVLRQAAASGELVTGLVPGHEAARLLALNHGLGAGVLVGQRTPDEAMAVVRYHLDLLFTPASATGSSPAEPPTVPGSRR